MILVDTSVWIDHLRSGNRALESLLEDDAVLMHEFVLGEIACGSLKDRTRILSLLGELPKASPASHDETIQFVEQHRLYGRGIGWLDAHLLASARLTQAQLWTLDKPLLRVAQMLGVAAS
jgi:predicted nucleic acid-binding protein